MHMSCGVGKRAFGAGLFLPNSAPDGSRADHVQIRARGSDRHARGVVLGRLPRERARGMRKRVACWRVYSCVGAGRGSCVHARVQCMCVLARLLAARDVSGGVVCMYVFGVSPSVLCVRM